MITLLGLQFWIDVSDAVLVTARLRPRQCLGRDPAPGGRRGLAVVCFRRGRKLAGLFGLFVPLVALIGALIPAAFQRLITRVSRS